MIYVRTLFPVTCCSYWSPEQRPGFRVENRNQNEVFHSTDYWVCVVCLFVSRFCVRVFYCYLEETQDQSLPKNCIQSATNSRLLIEGEDEDTDAKGKCKSDCVHNWERMPALPAFECLIGRLVLHLCSQDYGKFGPRREEIWIYIFSIIHVCTCSCRQRMESVPHCGCLNWFLPQKLIPLFSHPGKKRVTLEKWFVSVPSYPISFRQVNMHLWLTGWD